MDKGGKTLHLYVQHGPADHEDNAKIIKVIQIDCKRGMYVRSLEGYEIKHSSF